MKNIQHLLLVAALSMPAVGTFTACHDHDHDENDTEAPVVTIESPAEGASLSGEVHVHGLVTDASLHELSIKVTRDDNNAVLLEVAPEVHDLTEYDFDEHFTAGLLSETNATLVVTAEDHNSNVTTKTVRFKVK